MKIETETGGSKLRENIAMEVKRRVFKPLEGFSNVKCRKESSHKKVERKCLELSCSNVKGLEES
jgi:hypothetical protein